MDEYNGFISLDRKILQWEHWKKSKITHLFIYLLLKAEFRDVKRDGILIKRGSVQISLPKISSETGLSIQNIKTALKALVKTKEVTDKKISGRRIITVVKYNEYQLPNRHLTDNLTDNTNDATPHGDYNSERKGVKGNRKTNRRKQLPSYSINNTITNSIGDPAFGKAGRTDKSIWGDDPE